MPVAWLKWFLDVNHVYVMCTMRLSTIVELWRTCQYTLFAYFWQHFSMTWKAFQMTFYPSWHVSEGPASAHSLIGHHLIVF